MQIERDVPLAPLTTLRLGGAAARAVVVTREADVPEALAEATRAGVGAFVLGGGSNLVVGDQGFDGLVLRMQSRGVDERVARDVAEVTLAAGESWDVFVATAVAAGYAGVECLAGIPGLVGATPIQNVGAYGQEVRDTITRVRAYDEEERRFVDLTPAECEFGYRTSRLKTRGRWIVTAVTFGLPVRAASGPIRYPELARALGVPDGGSAPVARVREAVLALRRSKGMVVDAANPESVSAGSFFMNPVVDAKALAEVEARARRAGSETTVPRHPSGAGLWKLPAAWLIERSGFPRGYQGRGVHVSSLHTLALVNGGEGTTEALLDLARTIVAGVKATFDVTLVPEPVFIGCRL